MSATEDTTCDTAARWTTHGYWIGEYQWTSEDEEFRPALVARCGGPGMCAQCKTEQKALWQKLAAARSVAGTAALTEDMVERAAQAFAFLQGLNWDALEGPTQAAFLGSMLEALSAALGGRVVVDLPEPAAGCSAHGRHPHDGMRCLDCLTCVSDGRLAEGGESGGQ